jgi:hypothetical protein
VITQPETAQVQAIYGPSKAGHMHTSFDVVILEKDSVFHAKAIMYKSVPCVNNDVSSFNKFKCWTPLVTGASTEGFCNALEDLWKNLMKSASDLKLDGTVYY